MRRGNLYIFGFITVISAVAALLLSLTFRLLNDRQQLNIEADMKKNILIAVGLRDCECYNRDGLSHKECCDVQCCYRENIKSLVVDSKGMVVKTDTPAELINPENESAKAPESRKFPVFVRMEDGREVIFCVPVSGKGVWSTLYGYIALKRDFNTVAGMTFYRHGETPGLGAEIEKRWFLENFRGRKIRDRNGALVSISVVKGRADPGSPMYQHQVDGISGATLTGDGVTQLLLKSLRLYEPYFQRKIKEKAYAGE